MKKVLKYVVGCGAMLFVIRSHGMTIGNLNYNKHQQFHAVKSVNHVPSADKKDGYLQNSGRHSVNSKIWQLVDLKDIEEYMAKIKIKRNKYEHKLSDILDKLRLLKSTDERAKDFEPSVVHIVTRIMDYVKTEDLLRQRKIDLLFGDNDILEMSSRDSQIFLIQRVLYGRSDRINDSFSGATQGVFQQTDINYTPGNTPQNIIKFNDYGDQITRIRRLIHERVPSSKEALKLNERLNRIISNTNSVERQIIGPQYITNRKQIEIFQTTFQQIYKDSELRGSQLSDLENEILYNYRQLRGEIAKNSKISKVNVKTQANENCAILAPKSNGLSNSKTRASHHNRPEIVTKPKQPVVHSNNTGRSRLQEMQKKPADSKQLPNVVTKPKQPVVHSNNTGRSRLQEMQKKPADSKQLSNAVTKPKQPVVHSNNTGRSKLPEIQKKPAAQKQLPNVVTKPKRLVVQLNNTGRSKLPEIQKKPATPKQLSSVVTKPKQPVVHSNNIGRSKPLEIRKKPAAPKQLSNVVTKPKQPVVHSNNIGRSKPPEIRKKPATPKQLSSVVTKPKQPVVHSNNIGRSKPPEIRKKPATPKQLSNVVTKPKQAEKTTKTSLSSKMQAKHHNHAVQPCSKKRHHHRDTNCAKPPEPRRHHRRHRSEESTVSYADMSTSPDLGEHQHHHRKGSIQAKENTKKKAIMELKFSNKNEPIHVPKPNNSEKLRNLDRLSQSTISTPARTDSEVVKRSVDKSRRPVVYGNDKPVSSESSALSTTERERLKVPVTTKFTSGGSAIQSPPPHPHKEVADQVKQKKEKPFESAIFSGGITPKPISQKPPAKGFNKVGIADGGELSSTSSSKVSYTARLHPELKDVRGDSQAQFKSNSDKASTASVESTGRKLIGTSLMDIDSGSMASDSASIASVDGKIVRKKSVINTKPTATFRLRNPLDRLFFAGPPRNLSGEIPFEIRRKQKTQKELARERYKKWRQTTRIE